MTAIRGATTMECGTQMRLEIDASASSAGLETSVIHITQTVYWLCTAEIR